ncbi:MAG TPA: SDR family oxidoreductase [Acidobacteriota bacterium]|nr:SDR family oxidoreductase [Acidobacteriota bacterium]
MDSRVALITGAAKGVGAAISRKLAGQGYQILINYGKSAQEAEKLASELSGSTKAACFQADVGDPGQVDRLFDFCRNEFGKLDVLVNNASYSSSVGWNNTADQINWEEWEKTIRVDLKGTMLCSHAAFRIMEQQKSGKIVNFSSSAAIWGDVPTYLYTAAKFAIVGITRTLSRAFAPHVQVNCVAPGSIATEWIIKWNLTPSDIQAIANESPLKRIGTPEEVAELVAFLASPQCTFITGQTVAIDGGILLL